MSSILGPPRGEIEKVGSNERESCEDLSSDCFGDYSCDVSDEGLCGVPMPFDETESGSSSGTVFAGCV